MKKYKLIKIYPNSPELGTIIDYRKRYWGYDSKTTKDIVVLFHPDNPKKYSEFWEEVIEKDYEILSVKIMRSDKHEIVKMVNSKNNSYAVALSQCAGNSIHSVKRLSDGEIFTINDKINERISNKESFNINKIYIHLNKLMISVEKGSVNTTVALSLINKVKQPIFTTEDGVDIFEGDYYAWVTNNKSIFFSTADNNSGKNKDHTYFSTYEKASKYVQLYKKQYSKKDIFNILDKGFGKSNYAKGKHKVFAMFDIDDSSIEKQKTLTIQEIENKLNKHFEHWNGSTMIDKQTIMELLKQK